MSGKRKKPKEELFIEPDSIGGFVGNVFKKTVHGDYKQVEAGVTVTGDRLYLRVKKYTGDVFVPLDILLDSLMNFIFEVEKTGGVHKRENGGVVADDDLGAWTDLRDTYLTACVHLGRLPVVEGKRRQPAKKKYADRNLI